MHHQVSTPQDNRPVQLSVQKIVLHAQLQIIQSDAGRPGVLARQGLLLHLNFVQK